MRLDLRKFIKSQDGVSILEVIISAAIIGIASLVVLNTSTIANKILKTSKQKLEYESLESSALIVLKQILLEAKDSQGSRTRGLCEVIDVDSFTGISSGEIHISLNNLHRILTTERIKYEFAKVTPLNENSIQVQTLSDHILMSFQGRVNQAGEVNHFKFKISALNMNPVRDNGVEFMGTLSRWNDSYNVKDVILKLDLDIKKISANSQNLQSGAADQPVQADKSEGTTMVWIPEIGSCDQFDSSNNKVSIVLSGLGKSVMGISTLYNKAGFKNDSPPFEVNFNKASVQQGKLINNGQFITSDARRNIYGSCNEIQYRCPSSASNTRVYGPINMSGQIEYIENNSVSNARYVNAAIDFDLALSRSDMQTAINQEASKIMHIYRAGGERIKVDNKVLYTMSGVYDFDLEVKDTEAAQGATAICQRVCKVSNNYNSSSQANKAYVFEPRLDFLVKPADGNGEDHFFSYSTDEALGCTACYMKNCKQFGLGTFGPMSEQPYQPLDSTVPECNLKVQNTEVVNSDYPFSGSLKVKTPKVSSECITGVLTKDGPSLNFSLKKRSCSDNLPVLCYNYGKYLLARDISGQNQQLAQVNYDQASYRCSRTGIENLNQDDFNLVITPGDRTYMSQYASGENYSYLNLAHQGMFLAPQTVNDFKNLNNWLSEKNINQSRIEFWIALEQSGLGDVIAQAPIINEQINNDKVATFYGVDQAFSFYRDERSLIHYKGNNYGHLLIHDIKFKGLLKVRNQSPFGANQGFPVICRKSNFPFEMTLLDTSAKSIAEAKSACESSGDFFHAPTNPLEWIQAMTLVNPLNNNFAFPTPDTNSGVDLSSQEISSFKGKFAWVAHDYSPVNTSQAQSQSTNSLPSTNTTTTGGSVEEISLTQEIGPSGAIEENTYTPNDEYDQFVRVVDHNMRFINPHATILTRALSSSILSGANVLTTNIEVNLQNEKNEIVRLNFPIGTNLNNYRRVRGNFLVMFKNRKLSFSSLKAGHGSRIRLMSQTPSALSFESNFDELNTSKFCLNSFKNTILKPGNDNCDRDLNVHLVTDSEVFKQRFELYKNSFELLEYKEER